MPDISEFTPGPWVSNGQMVCSKTAPQRTFGDNGKYSADFIVTQTALYTSASSKEANANAKLIAAAPELLAALENLTKATLMKDRQFLGITALTRGGTQVPPRLFSHNNKMMTCQHVADLNG